MSRFSKWMFGLGAAMLLSFVGSSAAPAAVLITDPGTGGLRNDHQGTVGMVLRTGSWPVTVTALGYWDEGSDGLLAAHDVGLYDDVTQTLVASVTIQSGTGSTLTDEFRYESIAPVTLLPNTSYAIGSHYPGGGSGDRFRDQSGAVAFDLTGLDASPATRQARWSGGGSLSYPGNGASGNQSYVGPNMQYTVPPAIPIEPDLMGYWNFDDAANPGADQSGNYRDGATVGGATRTTSTTAGGAGALELDGSSGYLAVPTVPADFAGSAATLSLWVKLNNHTPTVDSRTGFASFDANTTNSHYTWTNGLGYFSTFRNGSRADSVTMGAAADRTEWAHLAVTTEPGTGTYRIYQNGQPVGQFDPGTFYMPTAASVGKSREGFFVDGLVDEVALRSTARTVAQIRAEYIAGVLGAGGIRALDLADIVGGGDGTGTGGDQGINPTTGAVETTHHPGDYVGNDTYHPVPDLPFVDGVFVPNGTTQINSDGDTAPLAGTNRWPWDNIWNGPNIWVTNNSANGVDFTTAGHSEIGFHINKGITFDLDAIRAEIPAADILRFMSVGGDSNSTAEFRVYLDDQLVFNQAVPYAGAAVYMDIPITASDRFLTLIAMNGGWSFLGDPQLLYRVPEPSTGFLAALGALCLVGCAWRRRKRG